MLAVPFAMILSASLPLLAQAIGRTPYPTEPMGGIKWSQGKPVGPGIDAAELESLYSEIAQEPHHDLKGIVIVHNGRLASERYFNGDSIDTLHDIRCATKSITSLLMGIAVQKGLVHRVNDSIAMKGFHATNY